MTDVVVEKVGDVYIDIHCDNGIAMEMNDYFAFYAKDYKYMPKYRNNMWDGKIRLFNTIEKKIYAGLLHEVIRFCIDREYSLYVDPALTPNKTEEFVTEAFWESLNLPFEPHDYQMDAVELIASKKRRLVLSPTSSGKSLIVYGSARWLLENNKAKKILVLVPRTSLVEQLYKDMDEYAENVEWCSEDHVHKIYDYKGMTRETDKPITVTTWQSVYRLNKKFFSQFDAVICDEAHEASAESIKGIMTKMVRCPYRIGLTGTIEDTETHKLVLTGLFGKVYRTATTKELMDRGIVSQLHIKGLMLQYPDDERKAMSKLKYQDEVNVLVNDRRRNRFISKLAGKSSGNTLILFNLVKDHGIPLYERIVEENPHKKVFLVHGKIKVKDRELIREITETRDDVIIIASYGTFSTGINIKRLKNLIFAHPFKAKIKNLQSIGRVLRKFATYEGVNLFDIADDYKWKSRVNATMKHFKERLRIYDAEEFSYKLIPLEIQ